MPHRHHRHRRSPGTEGDAAEPDIDWSPRIKVLGQLCTRATCVSVAASSRSAATSSSKGTIFGHYDHGVLRVAGKTRADVILSSDYTMEFSGEVTRRYALGRVSRMNAPTDYADATLGLAVDPELLEFLRQRERGRDHRAPVGGRQHAESQKPDRPKVETEGEQGRTRKACGQCKRAAAGETITEIDLVDSDLKLVPEDIGAYRQLRVLRLSKNNVESLPEWVGEFPALEVLRRKAAG